MLRDHDAHHQLLFLSLALRLNWIFLVAFSFCLSLALFFFVIITCICTTTTTTTVDFLLLLLAITSSCCSDWEAGLHLEKGSFRIDQTNTCVFFFLFFLAALDLIHHFFSCFFCFSEIAYLGRIVLLKITTKVHQTGSSWDQKKCIRDSRRKRDDIT